MPTLYPGALDSFVNPDGAVDNLDSPPHDDQHTDNNDATVAIETELGINPRGSFATVRARLDSIDEGGLPVERARDRVISLSAMSTTEETKATATLNIPASWASYDVDVFASLRVQEGTSATGETNVTIRLKVGGTLAHSVVEDLDSAENDNIEAVGVNGFLEGRTTTGLVDVTLTTQLSAGSGTFEAADVVVVAYAWRTS